MKGRIVIVVLSFLLCMGWTKVVDLTPDNFDDVINGDKAALVEFFAPWCGHCKKLAPEYERVGEIFMETDPVIIAKVDADKYKDLARQHGVTGYPTLKFFAKGSNDAEDYRDDRDVESMVNFINERTGLRRYVKKEPEYVVTVTTSTFESVVMNPNVHAIVEFYAPWCKHCKQLAPVYNKLAQLHEAFDDVVVAKVDATEETELAKRYSVSGYPSLKYFPPGTEKLPEKYPGGRSIEDMLKFMNEKTGYVIGPDGLAIAKGGCVEDIDAYVKEHHDQPLEEMISQIEEIEAHLEGREKEYGEKYLRILRNLKEKGTDYVEGELHRLNNMIESESVKPDKKYSFSVRKNILESIKDMVVNAATSLA